MARKKLFDSSDQKFDPSGTSLVSTDAQAAIKEVDGKIGPAGVPEAPAVDASHFRNGAVGGGSPDWTTELKGYKEARVDQGNVSAGLSYDLSVANIYSSVINGGITSIAVTPVTDHYNGTVFWQVAVAAAHVLTDITWTNDQGAPPMANGDIYMISLHKNPFAAGFFGTWTLF